MTSKDGNKMKEYQRKYRKLHPERVRHSAVKHKKKYSLEYFSKKRKEYKERLRKIVYEYYGNRCACCGERNLKFLSVDHVNNDGYRDVMKSGYRISGPALYLKIIKLGFPSGYQVLCMNCNFGKKVNEGICPHIE